MAAPQGYGYRAPPPPDVSSAAFEHAPRLAYQPTSVSGAEAAMNAELGAAKRRALAAELDTQQSKLAETEELRSQLLAHVKHYERELMEKQRQARIEAGHLRAASHRSELETQLLEARWQAQGAGADRALARRTAAAAADRFGANQRQQEGLLQRAIELEGRAASAHERAEQLRLGILAQRSRNEGLLLDVQDLGRPMGANAYLRRKLVQLQELQVDLLKQLTQYRRANNELRRASSRQLMQHAGLAEPPACAAPRPSVGGSIVSEAAWSPARGYGGR